MTTTSEGGVGARIWARDTTLWTTDPDAAKEVAERLGWLDLPTSMREHLPSLRAFASAVRADGIDRAVVLGMGGSSLCVEVLARTLGPEGAFPSPGGIPVRILDSTHPAAVAHLLGWAPPATSLYIVASKSGTTTEPNDFAAFFEAAALRDLGADAGAHFVAITDPGTPLVDHARELGYREVFVNPPDIGGRYAALSLFGLVPAALLGIDLDALLEPAARMAAACGPDVPDGDSPGVRLGRFMAEHAAAGRDKVTVLTVPELDSFGLWAEQLLAESTGKQGTGLVPVVGEFGLVSGYGPDRAVVTVGVGGRQTTDADALEGTGHSTLHLDLADGLDLAAEFFRWEFATAVAGHHLGINAFDQPDVQAAKDATKQVLARVADGHEPLAGAAGAVPVTGYADRQAAAEAVRELLDGAAPGDYVAVLAYLAPFDATGALTTDPLLARVRVYVEDSTGAATTLGLGPRYLHSTGQLHKGGPNTGRFIVLTETPGRAGVEQAQGAEPVQPAAGGGHLDVPGRDYTFATLVAAQAAGDLRALRDRGRRVLHLHLTQPESLRALVFAIGDATDELRVRSGRPPRKES